MILVLGALGESYKDKQYVPHLYWRSQLSGSYIQVDVKCLDVVCRNHQVLSIVVSYHCWRLLAAVQLKWQGEYLRKIFVLLDGVYTQFISSESIFCEQWCMSFAACSGKGWLTL